MVRPLVARFFEFTGQERFALIYQACLWGFLVPLAMMGIRVLPALHNFCGFSATFPIRLGRCGSTDGPSNLSSSQRLYRLNFPAALKRLRKV